MCDITVFYVLQSIAKQNTKSLGTAYIKCGVPRDFLNVLIHLVLYLKDRRIFVYLYKIDDVHKPGKDTHTANS